MSEPRKASEVLLSLEEKINMLLKIMSSYDMSSKITLDRVNKMYLYIESLKNETEQENQAQHNESSTIDVSSATAIPMSESPVISKRSMRSEESLAAIQPASQDLQPTPQKRSDSERKVPVMQRVSDQTGKDMFMAEVSIFDGDNKLVLKTKTNAAGKWQAYLKPAKYSVNIVKTDTETKKRFETLQDINVPDSSSPFTLPVVIIKR